MAPVPMTTVAAAFTSYRKRLDDALAAADLNAIGELVRAVEECWQNKRRLFVCGNGGSAANALHFANDFHYGIGKGRLPGLRVQALTGNVSVLTCLANDEGYDEIFSRQLAVDGDAGDILLVFSGSGNSPNIVKALEQARRMEIRSFAVLGYSGGKCKALADVPIHFAVNDMQISEDTQLVIGHMMMQWLCQKASGE